MFWGFVGDGRARPPSARADSGGGVAFNDLPSLHFAFRLELEAMVKRDGVLLCALSAAAIALAVRILFAVSFAASPLFVPLDGGHDRTLYHVAAQGPFWPTGGFHYLPLYPMVLKLVYTLFGPHLWAAAGLGIACDAIATLLIVLIAWRLGAGRMLASLAGLLYALYPLAIVYSCITMPNTLNALLAAMVVYGSLRIPRKQIFLWAGLGFLAGVAALGWAAWLLIAFALTAFWLIARPTQGPSPIGAVTFLVAFFLPLLPFGIHNTRAEGSFTLLTTHGGFNFYMGNNERATGYPIRIRDFRMTAQAMLEDAHRAAEKAKGRTLSRAESSAWWSEQGRHFWQEHPGMAMKGTGRKALLFWNRADVDDLRMVEQARLLTDWFTSPLWPGFFLIGSLGLIGVLRVRNAGTIRTVVLAGMAGLVLYFITARYRLTLAPLLLALGAAGVGTIWQEFCARKRIALNVTVILAATLCVAWPISIRDLRAVDYYNAAVQLLQAERIEAAMQMARAGLEFDSQSADLHHALGSGLFKEEAYAEAAREFMQAAARDPAHPQATFNAALSLGRAGDACGGLNLLRRAADVRPLSSREQGLEIDLSRMCATGP